MIVVPAILAAAVSIVNIFDGLTFLLTTTADAGDSSSFVAAGLSDGAHSFAAADTDTAGNTSAASQLVKIAAVPSITSFSATPRTSFFIDGTSYQSQTAGQSWSLSSPDDHTLRFEIRPGDHAWFDSGSVDRSEVESSQRIPNGTPTNIAYKFMLEPGAANTASWFVTSEMHNDDEALGPNVHTSPPFAIELAGEHLRVVARHCPTGLDPSNRARNLKMLTLWTDSNPIQRGQYYDVKMQANADNTGRGLLDIWVDGVEVVNYHGPLGYGAPTYWEQGLYRSADASQTIAANFRDLTVTTGSR
jgi:hypothetical protein